MTPEDKELLMKDLCARQPYKVKISIDNDTLFIPRLKYIDGLICHFYECAWTRYFDEIKPFLRPMSSMTDEERTEYFLLTHRDNDRVDNIILVSEADAIIDWLNAHHLDYRGLIKKGLALEAPENMYSSTTKSITIENIKYENDKIVKDAKRVVRSPEEMKEMEDVIYDEHGWKNIGNGLRIDRDGHIAGGLKFNKSCTPAPKGK